jgi:hypothetical protein
MSEPPNITAHAQLADAVDRVINGTIPEAMADYVAHMELCLRNYRLAEVTAKNVPFAALVNGAIAQLDAGDTVAARKFLLTMLGVVDFAPVVDVPIVAIATARMEDAFKASHTHADGGVYQYVDEGWIKVDDRPAWVHGVFYRGDDMQLRGTSMGRWMNRFKLIAVDPSIADPEPAA